jgi:DNA-binding NtrC family response regulator
LTLGADPEAGLKVAQEAKATRPKIGIIYTTGAGVNEGMKAMFVEPFLFLPKPYTFEQLTDSIAFIVSKSHSRGTANLPQLK